MFCVLALIGLAESIVSIITVSFACRVLSEPYKTWMTSEHVAIPMTATSSNVQVPMPPLNDTSKDFEYALQLQEEEAFLNGNQSTMTVSTNPELKAMEKARIEKLFPKEMRGGLSDMQLYLGGIAGLLQIILVVTTPFVGTTADLGAGIWCGLVIGIAGGIGLITTNSPSRRSIKALLVMSIFAAIFAQILIFFSWYGVNEFRHQSYYGGVSRIPDSKTIKIINL